MFLLIDKPKGITSHDVIFQLRKITGIRKIGHAGTLDPNATGLLIVGMGRESTKKLGRLTTDTIKVYIADIILGEERDTDDNEGKIVARSQLQAHESRDAKSVMDDKDIVASLPSLSYIEKVLDKFTGVIEQVPPAYSAIKIKGKKAYELARKGKEVEMKLRKVTIHSIEVLEYQYPLLKIKATVSSGTYIRALARDVGRELKTYGFLKNLRRTKIANINIYNSVKLKVLNSENWKNYTVEI